MNFEHEALALGCAENFTLKSSLLEKMGVLSADP